jgi:calcineurin-like phosphoesterase family protein
VKIWHRALTAWRVGERKPANYLVMAPVPDRGMASLISSFPDITGCHSGESRDPHVTLFGPFFPKGDACLLPGIIGQPLAGVNHFSCTGGELIRLKGLRGGAIGFRLIPGARLQAFYHKMVECLDPRVSKTIWIDRPPGQRLFHISLRYNIPFRDVSRVWDRVVTLPLSPLFIRGQGKEPVSPLRTYLLAGDAPIDLFRISLLRRGFLWKEYDLPRRRWLSRSEALDQTEWVRTREEYRKGEGFELRSPVTRNYSPPFVIGDLHLGHAGIIDYCRRPFSSSREMDKVLIRNWNYTVRPGDGVFFLGDLRHGRHAPPAEYYLERLCGRILFIRGNHDKGLPGGVRDFRITHCGITFLLIHDPEDVPAGETSWVLHAHHHNNNIAKYPFINTETRTINVSAELVNYAPVGLDEIARFIRESAPREHLQTLKDARERYPLQDSEKGNQ